jgi:hypothetical protein
MMFSAWPAPMTAQATKAQQQRNYVFCAVRAEMLKAGRVSKISGREPQGAWSQDELIGGKLPVVKQL